MNPTNDSLIRIALLGADAATPALAQAILESEVFELVGVCELDEAPLALAAQVRTFDVWEALLDTVAVDAVVVARAQDQDRRAEQLRKFIQTGVPLLVSHPVVDSMLVYYELDMIRRETGGVVVPHLAERRHPAIRSLAEMLREGPQSPIGKIEQLVVERCVVAASKAGVAGQFARDVDLVRALAGEMTRLGALAAGSGELAYASLGVHMSGPQGVVARWSVVPSRTDSSGRLTLLGAHGQAALEMPLHGQPWTIGLTTQGPTRSQPFEAWSPAVASLDQLARAMRGERPEPDWVDASRSVELAETIDRSLHKGRTIDLHFEEYTEQGTFKGTMASVGCGLLVLAMLLLGAVAIGEQMGAPQVRWWPYFLAGALGLFLLLQLLLFVFRRPQDEPPQETAPGFSGPRPD